MTTHLTDLTDPIRPVPRTAAPTPTPTGDRRTRTRALGWAAAAATLPYLTLKVLWLAGNPVGTTDPAFLTDPAITVLNAVTLVMDLVVVAVALGLTHRWGERAPAWLVLLPVWAGTGFLVPMALAALPATLLGITAGGGSDPGGPLEPWVQPLVYGGFAAQGVLLVAAFVGYARRRWSATVMVPAAASRSLAPLLRVVAGGGVVMTALSAALHAVAAGTADDVTASGVQTVSALLAVAGAAGVVALVRGRTAHRRLAVTAAWTGSGAMFSWGLWAAVTTMSAGPLANGDALVGMARLTGLLGGFALAVAALLALVGTGVAQRSTPAGAVR